MTWHFYSAAVIHHVRCRHMHTQVEIHFLVLKVLCCLPLGEGGSLWSQQSVSSAFQVPMSGRSCQWSCGGVGPFPLSPLPLSLSGYLVVQWCLWTFSGPGWRAKWRIMLIDLYFHCLHSLSCVRKLLVTCDRKHFYFPLSHVSGNGQEGTGLV